MGLLPWWCPAALFGVWWPLALSAVVVALCGPVADALPRLPACVALWPPPLAHPCGGGCGPVACPLWPVVASVEAWPVALYGHGDNMHKNLPLYLCSITWRKVLT